MNELEGEPPVTMVMAIMSQIARAVGVQAINRLDHLWEYAFTDREGNEWHFYTNGHGYDIEHESITLHPYNMLAYQNGLPIMICSPHEGTVIGHGTETELVQALSQELLRVTRGASGIVPG